MGDRPPPPETQKVINYFFATQIVCPDQAGNAQYPALHLRQCAFGRRQVGFQERGKAAILVGAR